jgi:hypothetical protein
MDVMGVFPALAIVLTHFARFSMILARRHPLLNWRCRYILASFIGGSDMWSEHAGWRFP